MNERIHKVLDGELSRAELTPEEQSALAEFEATIAATSMPRHRAPDLSARVMARIAALESEVSADAVSADAAEAARTTAAAPASANPFARAFGWLWTPRPFVLRPAWAFGAAALVLAVLLARPGALDPDAAGPIIGVAAAPAASTATAEIYVHFRLDAPDASSVHLAGDFTEWQPSYELHESQPGVWTVIVPLQAGVHDYAFVVDGERWTPDPLATAVDDGFGGQNSRLSLLPPERTQA